MTYEDAVLAQQEYDAILKEREAADRKEARRRASNKIAERIAQASRDMHAGNKWRDCE